MWIGSIRLVVQTKDQLYAGTDSLVIFSVLRNGATLGSFRLDYPDENDLERGAIRNYDYLGPTKLPRRNDKTPSLPPGIGRIPSPYPGWGFEFSDGLPNHLALSLRIQGDDMWIKDNIDLYIKEIRQSSGWKENPNWTYIATWSKDLAMSTDSSEGYTTLLLTLK